MKVPIENLSAKLDLSSQKWSCQIFVRLNQFSSTEKCVFERWRICKFEHIYVENFGKCKTFWFILLRIYIIDVLRRCDYCYASVINTAPSENYYIASYESCQNGCENFPHCFKLYLYYTGNTERVYYLPIILFLL